MINEKKLIEDVIPILNKNGDMYLAGQIIACIDMQQKTDWIPIGQYPSEPSLLYFENGKMCVGFFDYDCEEWNIYNGEEESDVDYLYEEECNPIAWQPLPQPYKKEGAE